MPQAIPTGRDVLVLEDEARVRNMLSQALKEMGFNATFTSTASAASKAMAAHAYDILILDLNLPGMNGLEFLESIRAMRADIQVIILTGFGDLEAAKKAIHLDVVEFLTKPCGLGNLETALNRACKRRRGQLTGDPASGTEPLLRFETEPGTVSPPDAGPDGAVLSMEEVERRHILSVLKRLNGNRPAAAAELGISIRKLYYRIGEYQKKGIVP
jgi:DNA-binding NtrC family response regulator